MNFAKMRIKTLMTNAIKRFKNNSLFIIPVCLMIFAGGIAAFAIYRKTTAVEEKEYTIEIQKDGFNPNEITIAKGDRIVFINNSDGYTQPASDPHPTHEYLAGFDTGRPLAVGEQWSFKFEEVGVWRYHDHLNVSLFGDVTVLSGKGAAIAPAGEDCGSNCYAELMRKTVAKGGIEAAYDLLLDKYEGGLPTDCHWVSHKIGEAAYDIFKTGEKFPISAATAYCGYGFYHGFLEKLLRENPDTDNVLSFCKEVENQLGEQGRWNCYHGIGHGFTEDPPDPKFWGDANAMNKAGIKVCEYLFGKSFFDLNLCLTGVYTVLAGFAGESKYGLSIDPEDSFAFCRTQPYRYQKACYGEFAAKVDAIPGWTMSKFPELLATMEDGNEIRLVTWVVPSVLVSPDIWGDDFTQYIYGCRDNLSGELKNLCLGGLMVGFFTAGEPGNQHVKALKFCASEEFLEDERIVCYGELGQQIRREYSPEKAATACGAFPEEYRRYCPDQQYYKTAYDDPDFDQPEPARIIIKNGKAQLIPGR
jgi:plastocyanin